MRITKDQWNHMSAVKTVKAAYMTASEKDKAIRNALLMLTSLHKFDSIEGITNLKGALEMVKNHSERVLRECRVPVPSCIPHKLFVEQFLGDMDFLTESAPVVPTVDDAIASLTELNDLLNN